MNCKEIHRNNKNAQQAFLFMIKAKTKSERTFWRNAWLLSVYMSLRAWRA